MAKQKYYVVWEGKTPGIYTSWPACQQQVNGVTGAKYKAFESRAEAEKAYANGWKGIWGNTAGKSQGSGFHKGASASISASEIDYDSISVDVGTRGNPGPMEYKGVDTRTGDVLFSVGPIPNGTNNIGEFLAIVHALAYLQQQGSSKTIYSDSVNAMKWVRQKKAATTLKRDASAQQIWDMIDRAEKWLATHTYNNKILKWETKAWGEIKADYGRK
ncbi:ribonuclease H family protein [Paenibacillus urinalis]|uniref:Ribonuclease H n=1 Tax=Paenibacillus urinalis TaxID=521520 RepID=A0AAX3N2L3_9BACL|nr:ribonuclease H family protein [Paenibacillus urinalis]WDH84108.1 ribonuclease H family protein [Paenibacillus urinalis]WDH95551.1 ribonuclease H family protein [Paenibacillus urinalis]WDI03748.1 ribonuclease H family protein [Paenibacillus urinalis]